MHFIPMLIYYFELFCGPVEGLVQRWNCGIIGGILGNQINLVNHMMVQRVVVVATRDDAIDMRRDDDDNGAADDVGPIEMDVVWFISHTLKNKLKVLIHNFLVRFQKETTNHKPYPNVESFTWTWTARPTLTRHTWTNCPPFKENAMKMLKKSLRGFDYLISRSISLFDRDFDYLIWKSINTYNGIIFREFENNTHLLKLRW